MTTAVTATARDAWALATEMATQKAPDDDVVAARRRAWLRRALPIIVGLACILTFDLAFDAAVGTEVAVTPVWDLPFVVTEVGIGLAVLGFVLTVVANVRSSAAGLDLKFVGPADLLRRPDRTWVREQINGEAAVPADRRAVVVTTARRMSDEGRTVLLRVGQLCIPAALLLSLPAPSTVVLMTVLAGGTVVAAIRDQVLARRGTRWLDQHG